MRLYKELSPVEKVEAILAAIKEPLLPYHVLHLGGLVFDNLSRVDQDKVQALLETTDVTKTRSEGHMLYMLNDNGRKRLAEIVDMTSVHEQIANVMWTDLGMN